MTCPIDKLERPYRGEPLRIAVLLPSARERQNISNGAKIASQTNLTRAKAQAGVLSGCVRAGVGRAQGPLPGIRARNRSY